MNPLRDPEAVVRRIYSYVAYRIGDGPDAEDVTSDVVERMLRYRATYDPSKGSAYTWAVGIARRVVDDDSLAPRAARADRRSGAGGSRPAHHRESLVRSGRRLAWQNGTNPQIKLDVQERE